MGLTPGTSVQNPMEYTLTQFRDSVGLSLETHRHWKRVLPPLTRRRGRLPCFTIGDLIAAGVVSRITEGAGVRVGHLSDIADALFTLCNSSSWATLVGSTLVIDLERRVCELVPPGIIPSVKELVLFCRLDPILDGLRAKLLKDQQTPAQSSLRFPPVRVSADRRRKRA